MTFPFVLRPTAPSSGKFLTSQVRSGAEAEAEAEAEVEAGGSMAQSPRPPLGMAASRAFPALSHQDP